jgi:NAD(P)-dependent dehydrogenase (short-subunit alcohol dehydrogenase family)
MSLSGSIVMVFGAGRGIGRAAAEMFAEAGARLVLASRTEAELSELGGALEGRWGAGALCVPTDVTRGEGVLNEIVLQPESHQM